MIYRYDDKKKKELADIIINTDRGKRHVFNKIIDVLRNSFDAKNRPNSKIIYYFQK